ncbi:unnamed protein product [Pedinophyceae sp. YPF-701]|nr:unnamed protein product [Pedinophyceae sp. YPF-701]
MVLFDCAQGGAGGAVATVNVADAAKGDGMSTAKPAGAAGMACAYSLSRHPEKFDCEVWEALPTAGGVATSCVVKSSDGMEFEMNDQVQGGVPSYRNNLLMFEEFGFKSSPLKFRVCFGKGDNAWTNHSPSKLAERLQPEIEKFGKALKWISRFEFIFVFVPINKVLKWWGFSDDFANRMVFPLTALFFGTGNQTPYVSAAIIARVFRDKELALFHYSAERLLHGEPDVFAFENLENIFTTIAKKIPARVFVNRPVASVERGPKVTRVTDKFGRVAEFDDVVFTCSTEVTRDVLKSPSWLERKLLANVRYFDDLIVTHEDHDYMEKEYEMHAADNEDMYFIRTDPEDPSKVEMSFNLSMYQPHLLDAKGARRNLYQTIFLDARGKDRWTIDAIDEKKILKKRWTRQFAHTWTHFAKWVPFVRFIQNTKRTWYAGAVTVANTHEVAVMSGFAVAHRLGAPFPYFHDPLAYSQMKLFMSVTHGTSLPLPKEFKNKHKAS